MPLARELPALKTDSRLVTGGLFGELCFQLGRFVPLKNQLGTLSRSVYSAEDSKTEAGGERRIQLGSIAALPEWTLTTELSQRSQRTDCRLGEGVRAGAAVSGITCSRGLAVTEI
jgi:hypothetical protein